MVVPGRSSLHRHFCILVNCRLLEQIVGKRKPPDLKAHFRQATKQNTFVSSVVLHLPNTLSVQSFFEPTVRILPRSEVFHGPAACKPRYFILTLISRFPLAFVRTLSKLRSLRSPSIVVFFSAVSGVRDNGFRQLAKSCSHLHQMRLEATRVCRALMQAVADNELIFRSDL